MTSVVSNLILFTAIVCSSQFGGYVVGYVNKRSQVRVSPLTRSTSSSVSPEHCLLFDNDRGQSARRKSRKLLSSSSLSAQSTYNSDDSRTIAPPVTNQNLHRPMKVMGTHMWCYRSPSTHQIFHRRDAKYMICWLILVVVIMLSWL